MLAPSSLRIRQLRETTGRGDGGGNAEGQGDHQGVSYASYMGQAKAVGQLGSEYQNAVRKGRQTSRWAGAAGSSTSSARGAKAERLGQPGSRAPAVR